MFRFTLFFLLFSSVFPAQILYLCTINDAAAAAAGATIFVVIIGRW